METVRVEREGPVLRVTLARPEKRNAFDASLIAELTAAFSDVGDVGVVVLAGDGPAFSAGADIAWMRESVDLSHEQNVADALLARRMLQAIDGCPAPVVCRVHGVALEGAAGLVARADLAIAAEDAGFGFTECDGLIPAVISPFVVARIGPAAARRYFLTGEQFGAPEALRIGLVDVVAEDLDAAVNGGVARILAGGPEALRAAKRLVLDGPLLGDETATRLADRRTSAEGQEGLQAFFERRLPRHIGELEEPWRSRVLELSRKGQR